MEKELKISELAGIWSVSVPTTWNRVKKMGLKTFIKKSETNKDINYVSISDEQIQEYVVNLNNNVNNGFNNVHYEETLSNNNVKNNNYNVVNNGNDDYIDVEYSVVPRNIAVEVVTMVTNASEKFNERLITVNNNYNKHLQEVYEDYNNRLNESYEELITLKSNQLVLEEKASREGEYIKEINELKTANSRKLHYIYVLITVIVLLFLGLTGYVTYNIAVNNLKQPVIEVLEEQPQPILNTTVRRK